MLSLASNLQEKKTKQNKNLLNTEPYVIATLSGL